MNTFVGMMIGLGGGALSGWAAGFVHNYLTWWGKDLRDDRLRTRGLHLPKDRVFPHYQWFLAVVGGFSGAFLAIIGLPPLWAALSIFIIPLLFLPFLTISAVATFIGSLLSKPRHQSFNPETLVGRDVSNALRIVQEYGWNYEIVEDTENETSDFPPLHPFSSRYRVFVEIKVRSGKVTKASIGH